MHSLVSVRLFLFAASLVVFVVSIVLIQRYSRMGRGGDDYVRRNKLKMIGYILLFPAILLLGLAAFHEQMSSGDDIPPIDPAAAAAAQAYVPPVLPKPTEMNAPPNDTWRTRLPSTNGSPTALMAPPTAPPEAASSSPSHQPSAQEQLDLDLIKVNAQIQINPADVQALSARGNIYAGKREWFEAERDYQAVLALDGTNNTVKFNLAEMSFMQKKYDQAKAGFVALKPDADMGDLAAYKAFLCDLFGGQEDAASKELDAFNQVGSNASYYFANAAWSLVHKNKADARNWLKSATRIYPPAKFRLYATSLFDMGYLPLPPENAN